MQMSTNLNNDVSMNPPIEWISSENLRSSSTIPIFERLAQKLSVLPRNCQVTPVNTRAWKLHDGTSCFATKLLEILSQGINLFVCYSDLLHSADTRSAILRAYCRGNWLNEPKSSPFGTPWSAWSWIIHPDPDPPKGTQPEIIFSGR